jgi:hypothetical protein
MAFEEFKGELDAPGGSVFVAFSGELDAPKPAADNRPTREVDYGNPQGFGASEIIDMPPASKGGMPSVLQRNGGMLPELPFDPAEAMRLSGRKYAEASQPVATKQRAEPIVGKTIPVNREGTFGRAASLVGSQIDSYSAGFGYKLGDAASAVGADAVAKDLRDRASNLEGRADQTNKSISLSADGAFEKYAPQILAVFPTMAVAAATGGLPVMFGIAEVQSYAEGRKAGLSPAAALGRAVPMGAAEVIGEKLGGTGKLLEALEKAAVKGGSLESLKELSGRMAASGMREVPSEEATYAMQFGIDKAPGIGLNPNAGMDDFLEGAKDTAIVAAGAGGMMAGGGMALNRLAAREKAFAEKYPTDHGKLPGVLPPPVDPIADIGKAQTVDQAIAAAQSAVQSSTAVDNIGRILAEQQLTQPAGLINSTPGLSPDIAGVTQAIINLENSNASPIPEGPSAQAATPAAVDQIPAGTATGNELQPATAGALLEAVRAEPMPEALTETSNVQNQPSGTPGQTEAAPAQAPEARAVAGIQAAAAGAPAGTGALEAAGIAPTQRASEAAVTQTARQVAIASEKARIEAAHAERAATRAEASKPMEGLSVGIMPNSAEPVTVRNGVVYIGKYPASNFNTGEDVLVKAESTLEEIRQALIEAGALGKKSRVFGTSNQPAAQVKQAPEATQTIASEAPNAAQQRADFAASEKTRKVPGNAARTRANAANPFKAFLGKHGISNSLSAEFAPGRKERQASMVQGYGPIFRKSGPQLDALAARAVEEGFLLEPDEAKLQNLILDALRGKRIIPQYAEGVAETEMEGRMAEAQERAANEEDARQVPDDILEDLNAGIPEFGAASKNSLEADMRSMGFTEQEITDATAKQPQGQGQNSQSSGEDTAPSTEGAPGTAAQGNAAPRDDAEGLIAPTREQVLDQQDRRDNADSLDQRQQIDREASGQPLTSQTAPEQRSDTSGDMFAAESDAATQSELGNLSRAQQAAGEEFADATPELHRAEAARISKVASGLTKLPNIKRRYEALAESHRLAADRKEQGGDGSAGLSNASMTTGDGLGALSNDPDPAEAIKVQAGIEGKTAIDAAMFIARTSPNKVHQRIAFRVAAQLRKLEAAGLTFSVKVAHPGQEVHANLAGKMRGMTWRAEGSKETQIWIQGADVKGLVGTSYETVLHELLHAVTQSAVYIGAQPGNTQLHADVADLKRVHQAIIRHFNKRVEGKTVGELDNHIEKIVAQGHDSLRRMDEVISWGLTNKAMQDYLESIPYQSGTLWSEFVTAIRKMLGLDQNADTVLSEILRITDRLMDTPGGQLLAFEMPTQTNYSGGLRNAKDGGQIITPAERATAILDAAQVTGKERIDVLKDVKKGDVTPEELQAAYPAKSEGLTAPSKQDILDKQQRAEVADKAEAKANTNAENKAKADAERGEFTLTGSDRAADVGAAGGQNVMFARNFSLAAQAQATEAVERLTQGITTNWKNSPPIIVAFDMQDDRIPERVRQEDLKQRSGGAGGAPEGFYYAGKVYLLSSKLNTPQDTARVLFHEALGHYGLRGQFGGMLKPILRDIVAQRGDLVTAKIKEYGLRGVNELDRLTAAEEVLAELAQTNPEIRFVRQAIAAIRTWLRENIPGFKNLALSDAEIIRNYILPARNFVERRKRVDSAGALPAFMRGTNEAMTNPKDVVGNSPGGRSADAVRAGDVFRAPNGEAVTVMRALPGGKVEVRIQGNRTRLGDFTNNELKAWEKIGRADYADGSYTTPQPLIDLAKNEPTAPDSGGAPIAQTDTPAFKKWFVESKVVDAAGKPLVVYHGTNKSQDGDAFSSFDTYGGNYGLFGLGAYFTENPDVASSYVKKGRGITPTVYPAFMSLQNPMDMDAKADPTAWQKAVPETDFSSDYKPNGDTNEAFYRAAEEQLRDEDALTYEAAEMMQEALRTMGHDGITHIGGGRVKSEGVKHRVFIAFESEQIKSATGNNGDFDPGNPDIRFSRAATQTGTPTNVKPILSPWRDVTGRLQFAPGAWLYDQLGKAASPMLVRLGMKAATTELRRQLRQMKIDVEKAQDVAVAIARETTKLSEAERAMVSDLVEQELKVGVIPPAHAVKLAAMINDAMGRQTDQLVELGMLTKDSADKWRGKYLPRYYESKLKDKLAKTGATWADALMGLTGRQSVMKGIKGKNLKGRGLYETIPEADLPNYEALGWEVRDPDYQPSLPSVDGTVQVWRDFSPAEREKMGEIRDAGFRFVMGYMQTQRDIALGRMFERMAQDPESSSRLEKEGYVQVPTTVVSGTGAKVYGKLAGRWAPRETMSQLSNIEESTSAAWQMYRKAMAVWKMGKTAMNPVSHVNNVVSNLTMAHLAGVSYLRGDKYIAAARDFVKKTTMLQEAKDNGLFLGTLSDTELMNSMPEELRILAQKQESTTLKVARTGFDIMTMFLRKPMGAAYQAEDTFFRYLIYKDARERGADPQDAVDYAQRYIFTYDDLPKGARRIRDFGVPFFSYTYKAAPALLHTTLTHPLRMAAPAAVLWGINAAAYAIATGDDDDDWQDSLKKYITDPEFRAKAREQEKLEREHLPPWNKGTTSMLTPKMIRMGMDEVTKLPLFIDVSRIIPGGDLFDISPNAGGIPLPQPITPSHPLFTTAMAMLGNKDLFRGKDLVDKNDTTGEATEKRLAWLWTQLAPAIAAGNYHWQRGMSALAQANGGEIKWMPDVLGGDATDIGRDGLPVQPKYAAMQTFGIKVRPMDLDTSAAIDKNMQRKLLRDIDAEMSALRRLERKGAVSPRAVDKARELANMKEDRIKQGLTVDGDERR